MFQRNATAGFSAACLGTASLWVAWALSSFVGAKEIDFTRDIQPVLASKCFQCHGPDEENRQADLRLDQRSEAILSGAIVPEKPEQSELIYRIFTKDPQEKMPPAKSKETLTEQQKQDLREWVLQGAKYKQHWAFLPPERPSIPPLDELPADFRGWPQNPIDHFVLARLTQAGLKPSPEADRYALVRRVYLDLLGLPPTPEQADAFVHDQDPQAYVKLVDQLLKSPHYGERWARLWLDLARYADTNGYEKDRPRVIWPYRDWVIRALNADMPFDQFTIEQLAGDMLPKATLDQRVATGFHRNTMLNEEGGIDPLEYRFYAMVDRVATTGAVWLGLTTGCAQCHSHKYDPISHTGYYRLMALMNNADEPDLSVSLQALLEQRREILEQIAKQEAELPRQFPPDEGEGSLEQRRQRHFEESFSEWVKSERAKATAWTTLRPHQLDSNLPQLTVLDDDSVFSRGDITKRDLYTLKFRLGEYGRDLLGSTGRKQDDGQAPRITALRLEALPDSRLPAGGPGRAYYEGRKGDFFLSEFTARCGGRHVEFASASHSFGKISIGSGNANAANVIDGNGSTGWSTSGREGEAHQLVLRLAQPLPAAGELAIEMLFERHFAASLGRFRLAATTAAAAEASQLPAPVEALLARPSNDWAPAEQQRLRRYFTQVAAELQEPRRKIEALRKKLPIPPTTMVMQERPPDNPRKTYRHHRGEYLSPREEVAPGVPRVFPPLPPRQPANRLTFAKWLVSKQNPLVGRVTVNRAWRAFFGVGIVKTSGDFGTQSEPPSHPELLDWLACEFMDQGWSQKRLHRLIVTSATYRQSSRVRQDLLRRDPTNRLLARGPRHRVDAEMVRDIMLQASGLLCEKVSGPSVYPPQPASVTALAYGNTAWQPSTGEDRYRRSLYTFSKRTAPFAAYAVFDGPTGENCVARRDRSNTALQALTLLNDEMYLELARAAAAATSDAGSATSPDAQTEQRAVALFRRFLTRPPNREELTMILRYYRAQRQRGESGQIDVQAITRSSAPQTDRDRQTLAAEAAWILVARAIMNLDETITK